jgi:hypothetical protein
MDATGFLRILDGAINIMKILTYPDPCLLVKGRREIDHLEGRLPWNNLTNPESVV